MAIDDEVRNISKTEGGSGILVNRSEETNTAVEVAADEGGDPATVGDFAVARTLYQLPPRRTRSDES